MDSMSLLRLIRCFPYYKVHSNQLFLAWPKVYISLYEWYILSPSTSTLTPISRLTVSQRCQQTLQESVERRRHGPDGGSYDWHVCKGRRSPLRSQLRQVYVHSILTEGQQGTQIKMPLTLWPSDSMTFCPLTIWSLTFCPLTFWSLSGSGLL